MAQPTTGYIGRSFLMLMSPNGGSTYTAVGGCQATDVTINNSPVDITNVLSVGFKEWLGNGGDQDLSITASGVVANNAQLKLLQAQAFTRTSILYQFTFGNAGAITALRFVQNFKLGGKYNDAQTWTGTFVSTGTVTAVADS